MEHPELLPYYVTTPLSGRFVPCEEIGSEQRDANTVHGRTSETHQAASTRYVTVLLVVVPVVMVTSFTIVPNSWRSVSTR